MKNGLTNNLKVGSGFYNLTLSYDQPTLNGSYKDYVKKFSYNLILVYKRQKDNEEITWDVPLIWQDVWHKTQYYINQKTWQIGDSFQYMTDINDSRDNKFSYQSIVVFIYAGDISKNYLPSVLGSKIQQIFNKLNITQAQSNAQQAIKGFNDVGQITMYLPDKYLDNLNYMFKLLHDINFAGYKFDKYISKSQQQYQDSVKIKPGSDITSVIQDIKLYCFSEQYKIIHDLWTRMHPFMWAKACTRDWGNEPANVMSPVNFVDSVKTTAPSGLKIEIWDRERLEKEHAHSLLAVSQGSLENPFVVILSWVGKNINQNINQTQGQEVKYDVALAGKGVTFDSGGINLKPTSGLRDMKFDMCGAATVAGILFGLAKSKSPVNVLGVLGLVENMPSGSAQRPGDVVRSMSGKTIEVLNTDAEGRMVLADVLTIIQNKYNVTNEIITIATLTGAVVVALGEVYGGIFGYNRSNVNNILAVADSLSENLWSLPLHHEFDEAIQSKIADVANLSSNNSVGAGSSTAAHFVGRFVQPKYRNQWLHFDVAGVASIKNFATGFGVVALSEWIRKTYG